MRKTKLAFMPVSCALHIDGKDSIGREAINKKVIEDAYKFLLDEGYEVIYNEEERIIDTNERAWEKLKYFKEKDVDCIIFYFAAWFWVTHYMQAIRWANIPIIGWSPNIARGWNFNNVGVMNGAMKEWGLPFKGVWGLPGDDFVSKRIRAFSDGAKVKNVLQHSKFGLIGGTSMGIAGGFADFNEWGRKFGIFTEHSDELLIIEKARSISKNVVLDFYKKLKDDYGYVCELNKEMDRSIRHYLSYQNLIKENGYDFSALKCTFDASSCYVSGCLSQALLAKSGYISTCEGDCYAALTERVFQIISDEVLFAADVQHINSKMGVLVLVDDGTANPNMATCSKCVDLKSQWKGESTTGGICIKLNAKPGIVTLARISREGLGNHVCLLAKGEVIEMSDKSHDEYCDCGFPDWPHALVKLNGDMVKFVDNMNVEYIHMVYGDIEDSMIEVCNHLDIKPVLC